MSRRGGAGGTPLHLRAVHSNGEVLGVSTSLCADQRLGLWSRDPHLPATRPSDHGVCRLPCSSPCDDQAAPCAEGRRIVRISDGRANYRKFRSIYRLLKVLFPG